MVMCLLLIIKWFQYVSLLVIWVVSIASDAVGIFYGYAHLSHFFQWSLFVSAELLKATLILGYHIKLQRQKKSIPNE